MNHGLHAQFHFTSCGSILMSRPSSTLVNRAFAVESFFKSGDRIDEAQIREMLQHGQFLLLMEGGTLIACVYVELRGERVYIGCLAVDPAKQKSGIGAA